MEEKKTINNGKFICHHIHPNLLDHLVGAVEVVDGDGF